jgi:hypothetical protein
MKQNGKHKSDFIKKINSNWSLKETRGKIKDFKRFLLVTKPRNWYWFKCSLSCEILSKRSILSSSYGNWNKTDFTVQNPEVPILY